LCPVSHTPLPTTSETFSYGFDYPFFTFDHFPEFKIRIRRHR
jgi:hypothetical protein